MRTRLVALAATLLLLGSPSYAVAGAGRGGVAAKTDYLIVTGYAMPGLKAKVIPRDAHALDIVGVDGVTVKPDGSGVTGTTPALRALRRQAHRAGLGAELLVANWNSQINDFDPKLATALLSSAAHRRNAVDRLAGIVQREGWDGVTIDLEALRRRDRDDLVSFLKLLRATLPAEVQLSIDVGAFNSIPDYRQAGFALDRLEPHVDRIVLMSYDQHGASWSDPGPIGALPWQRLTMGVLLSKVPREKVDLGVAGYGYTWPTQGTGHSISPRRARALAAADHVVPDWHPRLGEWSVHLSNGTVIWWSDARSYKLRLALATELGVHGMALWALGSADPLP